MLRLSIRNIEVDGEVKATDKKTSQKPRKVVQSSLDFASSYPNDLRLLMCDQQRGYGTNPNRSCIEAWRNPTEQMGGGGTVDTNTFWYADAEGVDAPTAHLSQLDLCASYHSTLKGIFAEPASDDPHRLGVPIILDTDVLEPFDATNSQHTRVTCGLYVVELNDGVKRLFSHYSNFTRVVLDHIAVRAWLHDRRLEMADIKLVCHPLYTRQLTHGSRMRSAWNSVLNQAEELRTSGVVKKACAKNLVNHLVGNTAKIAYTTASVRTVCSNDPTYLWGLMMTSTKMNADKAYITPHEGEDERFTWGKPTPYKYYQLSVRKRKDKTLTHHGVWLAVTTWQETQVCRLLRLIKPSMRVSCQVDCVEFYRVPGDSRDDEL